MQQSLRFATFLFLALPWLIFSAGFLSPWIGIPIFSALLYFLFRSVAVAIRSLQLGSGKTLLIVLILVGTLWVCCSGVGGHGIQRNDWNKHNQILKDLIEFPWPVVYENGVTLCYYIAYYLPAAVIGKLWGWEAAQCALSIYTWFGVILSLFWVTTWVPKRKEMAVFLFPLLGGLDFIGMWMVGGEIPPMTVHFENWAQRFIQYSSNTTLLFWVPQHALSGWLLTNWVVLQSDGEKPLSDSLLISTLAILWSPFVAIGLAPFWIVRFVREKWDFNLFEVLLSAALIFVGASYLFSTRGENQTFEIWEQTRRLFVGGRFIWFLALEFGIYFVLFCPDSSSDRKMRWVWWTSFSTLVCLPFFRMGQYNDLVMRASIPALCVLWFFVIQKMCSPNALANKSLYSLRLLVIGLGAFTMLSELSVTKLMIFNPDVPKKEMYQTLPQFPVMETRVQYFGDVNSFFNRRLAKNN